MSGQQGTGIVAKGSKVFKKVFETLTGGEGEKDSSATDQSAATDSSSQKSDPQPTQSGTGGSYIHRTLTRRKGNTYKAIVQEFINSEGSASAENDNNSTHAELGSPSPDHKSTVTHKATASESSTTPSPDKRGTTDSNTPTKGGGTERGRRSRNRLSKHKLPFGSLKRSRSVQDAITSALIDATEIPIPSSPVPVPGPPAPKHCESLDFGNDFESVLKGEMERMGFAEPDVEIDDEKAVVPGAGQQMVTVLPTPTDGRIFPMDDLLKADVDISRCGSLLSLDKLGRWERNHERQFMSEESYETVKIKKEGSGEEGIRDGGHGSGENMLKDEGALTPSSMPKPNAPNSPPYSPPTSMTPLQGGMEGVWVGFRGCWVGVLAGPDAGGDWQGREDAAIDGTKIKIEQDSSPVPLYTEGDGRDNGEQRSVLKQEAYETIIAIIAQELEETLLQTDNEQSARHKAQCPECFHCLQCAKKLGIGECDDDCVPLLELFSRPTSSNAERPDGMSAPPISGHAAGDSTDDDEFSKAATPSFTSEETSGIPAIASSAREDNVQNEIADEIAEADRLWFPLPDGGKRLVFETTREWGVVSFDARNLSLDDDQVMERRLSHKRKHVDSSEEEVEPAMKLGAGIVKCDGTKGKHDPRQLLDSTMESIRGGTSVAESVRRLPFRPKPGVETAKCEDITESAAISAEPAEDRSQHLMKNAQSEDNMEILEPAERWFPFRIRTQSEDAD